MAAIDKLKAFLDKVDKKDFRKQPAPFKAVARELRAILKELEAEAPKPKPAPKKATPKKATKKATPKGTAKKVVLKKEEPKKEKALNLPLGEKGPVATEKIQD